MTPRVRPEPFHAPVAVRRLPLDLLRSSLVSTAPDVIGQAILGFYALMAGAKAPLVLPQSAGRQGWKRLPGYAVAGDYQDPMAAAASTAAAVRLSQRPVGAPPPPFVRPMHAMVERLGANRLPSPRPVAPQARFQKRPMSQPLHPDAAVLRHNAAQAMAARVARQVRRETFQSIADAQARAVASLQGCPCSIR